MAETIASMRRPKRGRPPRPRESDFVTGEEFEDEEEGEDHGEAADGLAPPRSKRKREASAAAAAALEDLTLIDIVKHNGRLISHAVKRLVEDYESNPKSVLFQILTMLFEVCGARHDIYASDLHEAAVDDIVFKLAELARKGLVDDNYSSKRKDLKNFKENLVTFWDSLVLECQNGPLFDDNLFTTIKDYVVAISCTPPRVYRQVASLVGLQLVTSFISVAKTLSGQRETTQRQLNAEKKKHSDGPAVESLNKRLSITHENITYLEESMRKIFSGLFMHRYRDVDPEIRMLCIKSLGIWVVSYPSLFLQDIYLKYLGWTLNDKNAGVRRTSILALQSLYDVDDNIPSLGLFTERFYSRMIQLADDIDISVAVPAIGLIKQLLRHQLLSDDDLGPLYDLLIDEPPMIRRAIGELVYDHLIAQNCKTPSVARDGDNESSEIHISRMLHILREFSDDPVLSSYVIDDIWDDMKAMKDWKCVISMLLDETPIAELTDMDGTNLVRMLRASAKKAVGERIVLATDNRKMYYNKSQKEILENSKSDITNALMKRYPQLLRKYLPDKAKISPLIDMMMLLKLEMYSLKRQEQNFKAAIDLIVDAFFKHGDKDTLRSCIKAIAFCCTKCQADLLDYAENKLKTLEDELVLKVKTAIKEVEAGDDEYSLLVNLKRLHELQLSKPVKNDGLFEDMYRILSHLKEMDNEVKSFLLINMFLEVAWCLHAIDVENPSETSIEGLSSKQRSLFEQLYYFLVVLSNYQKEGRSTTVLSSRVCTITAEMWCLFKKSKYSSTKLKNLGYLPQLEYVQKFWKLCEQQLNISDDTEDEDANEEYIEDTNRDAVMIAAAKLLLADTVSKDYLGPEIVSHYVSHGASTTEIIKHLITALKKNANSDIAALFFEALRRVYERYMAYLREGENQNLIAKSYSECQDLANRLAGYYVGAVRIKNKSEILKIIQCGVQFAFVDLPKQLSFLEAALVPFVSKLPSSDIPDILTDVQKRAQDIDMNEDPSAWRPYLTFVEHLREKHARNEVFHEEKEEKPVKRRGRPRKPRDEPVRNLFDGNKSSDEESVSDSDQRGHGGDDDDEDDAFDQPLINTFRPSASKLRSLKGVSQQGTSSQRKAPTASGSNS
ncbi:sister-chromatid cohesion protein 3 [Aegilops tauschii subsp. strangulata]|uniref:Cohesin subunit SA-3 n=5 Tax=Aegilops tauschii subsp. strangulata TaxID=200361 RepID=A0A453HWU2_AEGTS|nr:sister-chromatid cohesion protein 3 [Aegilops tauschii subsp. strangulata]